ncbi:CDP-diacylglycerol--glycerol-3-phosphate 3-phosphatidyltransferase [Pelagibacterium lentulum]|uniref:CDP-diacylglycerol--glycerol-3-phosphate 3-phosphatidyltransferase n=1 Tax=Pelagibacterium lentulum TaxID=2029865 RepID=A0A916R950_9HYPH|nr:CDP-diacylglycerol--glycerol-3-phosphate 3-phosphatidyltransferase [Pelagibacterium lentulum]GGA45258.1 CDP-diacylglycerol--glycerol-3-phosphate 3-phosphatidyltransferase [Pelagibacterium lentulum]
MSSAFDMAKVPNYLTYGRIFAIPVIMALLLADGDVWRWLALALYIIAAITDFFDGYLARKYGTVSAIGRMLDPIADKLLVGALLLVFFLDGTFGVWELIPATIILLREIFISGLREFMGNEKIVVHVSSLAKYKTTIQLVALALVIAMPVVPVLTIPALALFWLAAILTAITGWQYWQGAISQIADREGASK